MASATLPLLGTLTRATTPERVAALLTQAILDGMIAPGTQLVEVDLAAQFGVSRHTVREAFRLLGREGFVEHAPFRGVSVRAFTAVEVADIYRARQLFEAEGVRMLASAGADAVGAIAAHATAFDAAVMAERWTEAFAADMAFHAGIVGLIGSPRINTMMHDLLLSLRVAQYVLPAADEDAFRRSRGQHREIVRALRAGNRVRAAAAVQRHLEDAERALGDALRQLSAGAAVRAARRVTSGDRPGGGSR